MDILASYMQHPRNPGRLPDPTYTRQESNDLCDDSLIIDFRIKDEILLDFSYEGNISLTAVASISFLYDILCGMEIKDINNMTAKIFTDEGMVVTQRRQKTLAFPLLAIIHGLSNRQGNPITTNIETFAYAASIDEKG